jgi:hypothetical protein
MWSQCGEPLEKERLMKKGPKKVKAIPVGYHTVTPYLACGDAARAIDRTGTVRDPFGHVWHIATHTGDLSMAELRKRGEKALKAMSS